MRTFASLLQQRQVDYFVDRETELGVFLKMFESFAPHRLLFVKGIGGIGKSALLAKFKTFSLERNFPTVYLDLSSYASGLDLMFSVRDQLREYIVAGSSLVEYAYHLDRIQTIINQVYSASSFLAQAKTHGEMQSPLSISAFLPDIPSITVTQPDLASTEAKSRHKSRWRHILVTYFNDSELRDLCFELGVDYDSLSGETRDDKARELIAHCERHGRIAEFLAAGKQLRTDVHWDDVPKVEDTLLRSLCPPSEQPPGGQSHGKISEADKRVLSVAQETLTALLVRSFNDLAVKFGHVVLLLDTYELVGVLDDWLRVELLPNLHEYAVVVIAGRSVPGKAWTAWRPLIREIELVNLKTPAVKEYLEKRGISEGKLANDIIEFTKGHPLCLALSVDVGQQDLETPEDFRASDKFLVMQSLLESAMCYAIRSDLENLILVGVVVRHFNFDLVHELTLATEDMFERMIGFSFVSVHPQGFEFHDLVRDYFLEQLKTLYPKRYQDINRLALEYYTALTRVLPGREHKQAALEVLYHQLALDEKIGLTLFQGLFEPAARIYDTAFCEELVGLVQSVQLTQSTSKAWLKYYQSILEGRRGHWHQQKKLCTEILREHPLPIELRLRTTMDLGNINMRDGRTVLAENLLCEGLDSLSTTKDEVLVGDYQFELAKVYRWRNKWQLSLTAYQKAEQLFRKHDRISRVGETLMHVGVLHQLKGNFIKAVEFLKRSLAIFWETENEYGYSRATFNLAWTYALIGQWDTALDLANASLETAKRLGTEHSAASILVILADLYRLQYESEKAEAALNQSLEIIERLSYDVYRGMLHRSWALLSEQKRNWSEAESHFHSSLAAYEGSSSPAEMALTLVQWGNYEFRLGRLDSAETKFNQVLHITKDYENHYAEVMAYIGLAMISDGRNEISRDYLNIAESLSITHKYYDQLSRVNFLRAKIQLDSNPSEAHHLFFIACLQSAKYNRRFFYMNIPDAVCQVCGCELVDLRCSQQSRNLVQGTLSFARSGIPDDIDTSLSSETTFVIGCLEAGIGEIEKGKRTKNLL